MPTVYPLAHEEQIANGGANKCWELTYADLTETTVNTAQAFTIAVEAGDLFRVVYAKLITPLEDASDAAFNSCAATIGDGGSATRFLGSTQLNVNGTEIDFAPGALGESYAYTAADTVDISIGSMTAKALSDIDAGKWRVYYHHFKANKNPAID